MTRRFTSIFALAPVVLVGVLVAPSAGQSFRVDPDDEWCRSDHNWDSDDDYDRYCEVREVSLEGGRDVIRVDAEPNGGISIHGWDKGNIRARVVANARSESLAKELAGEVRISTSGTIEAKGPQGRKREWYSVSYEIFAPRESNVDLSSKNGGIEISELDGRVRFNTLNGGVDLAELSGDVMGRTTNGGVSINLHGNQWDGRGLDVETVNGGVSIVVPRDYSAELETGTVNGRIDVDFPVLVQGRFDRRLNATLGEGGKVIRAVTTNGGVFVTRG